MNNFSFIWTDGNNPDFYKFYVETEKYYSQLVGGACNRAGFIPHNLSESISTVLLTYCDGKPVGCAGLKPYSETDIEIKRVWVNSEYRGNHIASAMLDLLEEKAKSMNYKRTILQTRPIMADAVNLYQNRSYKLISNYPPYDILDGAICMAKDLITNDIKGQKYD